MSKREVSYLFISILCLEPISKMVILCQRQGTVSQVAEKFPKYGHSEEAKTTKNLHLADLYDKQVLRFAQNDRAR